MSLEKSISAGLLRAVENVRSISDARDYMDTLTQGVFATLRSRLAGDAIRHTVSSMLHGGTVSEMSIAEGVARVYIQHALAGSTNHEAHQFWAAAFPGFYAYNQGRLVDPLAEREVLIEPNLHYLH